MFCVFAVSLGPGRRSGEMSGPVWLTDMRMARLKPVFPKFRVKLRVDDKRVLNRISICVVDRDHKTVARGVCPANPDGVAGWVRNRDLGPRRILQERAPSLRRKTARHNHQRAHHIRAKLACSGDLRRTVAKSGCQGVQPASARGRRTSWASAGVE